MPYTKNFDNLDFWISWLKSTPDIIFLKDTKGIYRGVSSSTAMIAGFDNVNEMIGKTDFEIYPKEDAIRYTNQDKEIIETKKTILYEEWMNHPQKGKIKVETLKSPLVNTNGEIMGVQGVTRDVTERYLYQKKIKEQQAQINAIIDNIPFPIWLKDKEGRYLLINKAYGEIIGYFRTDVIGHSALELAKQTTGVDLNIVEKFIHEDNKIFEEKIIVNSSLKIDFQGKEYFVEITKCPICDVSGEVIGIAGISVDVTSHKIYQDELMKARELAEAANKTKTEFLANISHEIRTPMNGIMGFMQLVSETNLNDEQKDFIKEAQNSSEILLRLLNDLLDVSKIEAGKMTMENISFSIRYVVEEVATLASSNSRDKDIEITALCHSSLPYKVFGDPHRLKQVLNNLVNNALKFTPVGEVVISARMIKQRGNVANLLFEVQDTGIGISEENQAKIFEAFTQADNSTTRKYGGTGLGLTISKNIVDMMHGKFYLESAPEEGSKFSFTAKFEIDESRDETSADYKELEGVNILVIDDNKTNINVINHYLKDYGINTYPALNIDEAFKLLKSSLQFDLILTDYCLSGTFATELTREIFKLENYKNVPIILLTSRAQRGDYLMAKENSLRGYLPKPIRKDDLVECISLILSKESNNNQKYTPIITRHSINEKRISEDVKILLVEDNLLNQKLTHKMLHKAGYICDIAKDGIEALKALENKDYDIILMDCQMPIMDGFETSKKIREFEKLKNKSHIKIIALTANAMHDMVLKCKDSGMDDYMAKPVMYDDLVSKLKDYEPKHKKNGINPLLPKSFTTQSIAEKITKELGIDEKDAYELIEDYLCQLEKNISLLEKELEQGNFLNIVEISHSQKGASGNLRFDELCELFRSLEDAAKMSHSASISRILNEIKNVANII